MRFAFSFLKGMGSLLDKAAGAFRAAKLARRVK
jgi:hypothetical protein